MGLKLFLRGGSNPSLTALNRNCYTVLQGVGPFIVPEKAVPDGLHRVALRVGWSLGIKCHQKKIIDKFFHVGKIETRR